MQKEGLFLTVEGIEGSGKSTQLGLLAKAFRQSGHDVVVTKEPGGTPLSDRIRAILLDPAERGMDPLTELFLYAASRREHVTQLLRPALEAGKTVLCDRFTDSTLAYQGFGRMLELDRLKALNELATAGLRPHLSLIYDLPEQQGLDRAEARNMTSDHARAESRLEGEDLRFHRRVREGYLTLAISDPKRYAVIDARPSPEDVFVSTLEVLAARFPRINLTDPSGARDRR